MKVLWIWVPARPLPHGQTVKVSNLGGQKIRAATPMLTTMVKTSARSR